jgi:hypothetical protein
MSTRQWLKDLAGTPIVPLGLAGVHRLETRHTVYIFRDGVCVDVARRDCEENPSVETTMINMRVVGWLLEVEGQRRLVERWLPGARAVLWRAADLVRPSKIALTSPSFGFVMCSQPDDSDSDGDTTAEWTPVPSRAAVTGSFTRLFPQPHIE